MSELFERTKEFLDSPKGKKFFKELQNKLDKQNENFNFYLVNRFPADLDYIKYFLKKNPKTAISDDPNGELPPGIAITLRELNLFFDAALSLRGWIKDEDCQFEAKNLVFEGLEFFHLNGQGVSQCVRLAKKRRKNGKRR